jgi:hypothetical protein
MERGELADTKSPQVTRLHRLARFAPRQAAGLLFDGDWRFGIVVRVPNVVRNDLEALPALAVMLPETNGAARRSVLGRIKRDKPRQR